MTIKSPSANAFVTAARKVYHPVGFTKGTLALDTSCTTGEDANQPLDCYYYSEGSIDRIGILLHLATILPAAILTCLQFVPVIRRTFVLFHRINGYLIIILSLVSTAGAIMLARNAVGGWMDVQMGVGTMSIAFVSSLALALYNVKRLQIEQHRAWMLRAWFYAGSIITMRLILVISTTIISSDGYMVPMTCDRVFTLTGSQNRTLQQHPECGTYFSGQEPNKVVLVSATMNGNGSNATAVLSLGFGAAFWLAFTLHAVGVEIYLRLTPAEANRLRNVSYQRQLEAGMKNPGRAGLTADSIGDAARWEPQDQQHPAHSTESIEGAK
ncbi:uncharacterized protein B0H64DRAFT_461913 [Chaetomium fimeti]|uniref:Uncharacterized protein n=1 Tax=Chaetomium fimeti TaxID=1854472 RepID=A0AAE0HHH5_9PEZI|nr:hypothetical protein B0H64DRAFT_461913 [Chaetomium fimeti]